MSENHRLERLQRQVTTLYTDLRAPLSRWLLHGGVQRQEADEIVQETFFRLYRHLHQGGGYDNLRGWVFQVAHNLSATQWKFHRRMIKISPNEWDSIAQSRSNGEDTPEALLVREESLKQIHKRLATLTQQQRDCVHLRIEGFRYKDIASVLGISLSPVAGSLRNAVVQLSKEAL